MVGKTGTTNWLIPSLLIINRIPRIHRKILLYGGFYCNLSSDKKLKY